MDLKDQLNKLAEKNAYNDVIDFLIENLEGDRSSYADTQTEDGNISNEADAAFNDVEEALKKLKR